MNADWFKNNIRSLIAVSVTLAWASVNHYAVLHGIHDSIVVNSINNIELVVLGYYFGSSKTNESKDIQK